MKWEFVRGFCLFHSLVFLILLCCVRRGGILRR